VLANVSNNVGLVPGVLSGIHGYRKEAGSKGHGARAAARLGVLLGRHRRRDLALVLPQSAFKAIVPALIALALFMVVGQPCLAQAGGRPPEASRPDDADGPRADRPSLRSAVPDPVDPVFLMGI